MHKHKMDPDGKWICYWEYGVLISPANPNNWLIQIESMFQNNGNAGKYTLKLILIVWSMKRSIIRVNEQYCDGLKHKKNIVV